MLVGSGIAMSVVIVPAILTFCLFTLQGIFNLSELMNWFTTEAGAQDQESHQAVGRTVAFYSSFISRGKKSVRLQIVTKPFNCFSHLKPILNYC